MAFKLQLTDEMIRFFRMPQLSDGDAGRLIRLLIDAAEGQPLSAEVPQHLAFTLPIFLGQIEAFREKYKRKVEGNAERVRRHRSKSKEPESDGRPDGIDSYDHIFDPRNDPVAMAVELCQESRPRMAAAGYARQRARIGDDAFRAVLATFWGEIRAGEEPRNRGAAFSARLKEQADFDPQEAEAARKAVAALNAEEQTP